MDAVLSRVYPAFSISISYSNISTCENSLSQPIIPPLMARTYMHLLRATNSVGGNKIYPKHLKFAKRNREPQSRNSHPRRGSLNLPRKTDALNLEVSPHRAVSAVRLMRIELGGAFADLLNEKGKGSGNNEMGYVERTLGFRTRDLDDRDLRLVTDIVGGTIRWRRYLDHLIMSLCHEENMFRGMEPLLLQILRIGFYEIVKLEMPPYAVVDEEISKMEPIK